MADKDDKTESSEEELSMVGPGAEEEIGEEPGDESEASEQEASGEEEEDQGDGDERSGHASDEEDDERTAIRRRRKEEKQRRKQQIARDRTELRFLRQRNEQLERQFSNIEARQTSTEVATIDARIADLEGKIREAESLHAAAVKKQDGDAATEALRIRDDFRDAVNNLKGAKAAHAVQHDPRRRTPNRPDPEVVRRVREWFSENEWFDPNLGDEDSAVAKAVEDSLYRERRLDPRTDSYWAEYNRRLKKRLPHLFEGGTVDDERDERDDEREDENEREERSERQERRATPKGPRLTTGGRERPLKKNEVYISAERKAAMVEAGVWDDPELRSRYLKRYQKYDREHGTNRR